MAMNTLFSRSRLGALAVAALLAGAAGCRSQGSVTGRITYRGKPVRGGTVLFVSADQK